MLILNTTWPNYTAILYTNSNLQTCLLFTVHPLRPPEAGVSSVMNGREARLHWARQMLKRFRKKKSVAAVQLVPHLPPEGQVPTGAEQIPPPAPLEPDPTNQNTAPLESCPTPAVATTLSLSSAARQVASERETAVSTPSQTP